MTQEPFAVCVIRGPLLHKGRLQSVRHAASIAQGRELVAGSVTAAAIRSTAVEDQHVLPVLLWCAVEGGERPAGVEGQG